MYIDLYGRYVEGLSDDHINVLYTSDNHTNFIYAWRIREFPTLLVLNHLVDLDTSGSLHTIQYKNGVREIYLDVGLTLNGKQFLKLVAFSNNEDFTVCKHFFQANLCGFKIEIDDEISTSVLAKMSVPWSIAPRIVKGSMTSDFDLVFRNEADAMTYRLMS